MQEFRERLQARLDEIEARICARKNDSAPVELDQSRVGRLTRMDAIQQQAMSQAADRRAEQERQRILAALKRIEDDEYGECLSCGEPIDEGRLRVDPSAALCMPCMREKSAR